MKVTWFTNCSVKCCGVCPMCDEFYCQSLNKKVNDVDSKLPECNIVYISTADCEKVKQWVTCEK